MSPPPRPTGLPRADAQDDFLRVRRRRALARVAARLRGQPADVGLILPFEEVVAALGRTGERSLGLVVIALDTIVGTVDRAGDFDRAFRPATGRVRGRWERIATAMRSGEAMPPISVFRVGEVHFVRDGHHRVSVARALGLDSIDAWVTEVFTRVGAEREITLADLPLKGHERLFLERVPLPAAARGEVVLRDSWDYALLAEGVEAWGFRAMQARDELLDRAEVARGWLEDEYRPVVAMLSEAGLVEEGRDAEAYLRIAADRFRFLRTHDWSPEIIEQTRDAR